MTGPISGFAIQSQNLTQLQSGASVTDASRQQSNNGRGVNTLQEQNQVQRSDQLVSGTPTTNVQGSAQDDNDTAQQRLLAQAENNEIGRASCRERVSTSV